MILKDKVILITGAGGLIGRTIANRLAADGAFLIITDINENFLSETCNGLKEQKFSFTNYILDITKDEQIEELFDSIKREYGRLDCLINNAGIQPPIGKFEINNLDLWFRNIEINLFGLIKLTHKALPVMMHRNSGRILNIAGGGSTSSRPNLSAYAVAKTGLVRFTEVLADELRDSSITVNAISPGAVNSKMLNEILKHEKDAYEEYRDALKRKEDGGTDPSLAAELIAFLCSDDSGGISGKLISAPWDPWREPEFREKLRNDKDLATLRRIDNKTFFKKL